MSSHRPQLLKPSLGPRAQGDGVILLDYLGERQNDFTADINASYDVDLRDKDLITVTPKALAFIQGDKLQLADSRFECSRNKIIRVRFTAPGSGYLFCGEARDLDLMEPGVSVTLEYRSTAIGFVIVK
jgi:hypothetical protein